VQGLIFNDARRTFVNQALEKNFSIRALVDTSSHSIETMAKYYARSMSKQKQEAVNTGRKFDDIAKGDQRPASTDEQPPIIFIEAAAKEEGTVHRVESFTAALVDLLENVRLPKTIRGQLTDAADTFINLGGIESEKHIRTHLADALTKHSEAIDILSDSPYFPDDKILTTLACAVKK
jgi:hypothetical protein